MSKTGIRLDYIGIGQILKGPEITKVISDKAQEITGRCGDGFGYRIHDSGQRQIATVYAENEKAKRDNLENNTLLKNLY